MCSSTVSASCNCAVAVRSADDVIVMDRCYRWVSFISFTTDSVALFHLKTSMGDKVSRFTHAYLHKSLSSIKVAICNHQADSPFCIWSDGELWTHRKRVWSAITRNDLTDPADIKQHKTSTLFHSKQHDHPKVTTKGISTSGLVRWVSTNV